MVLNGRRVFSWGYMAFFEIYLSVTTGRLLLASGDRGSAWIVVSQGWHLKTQSLRRHSFTLGVIAVQDYNDLENECFLKYCHFTLAPALGRGQGYS